MSADGFNGFPAIGEATMVPNLFFATVLPRLASTDELLAFLWVSRVVQARRAEEKFATAEEIWFEPGASESFERIGTGREGLERGLESCVAAGALLSLELQDGATRRGIYFINNPGSRKTIARARAGDLRLAAGRAVAPLATSSPPNIFRLYEDHIGTITPLMGEKLVTAEENYPVAWILEAFEMAAKANARNWRYIERVLERWAQEGRGERATRDSLEDRKRRYPDIYVREAGGGPVREHDRGRDDPGPSGPLFDLLRGGVRDSPAGDR